MKIHKALITAMYIYIPIMLLPMIFITKDVYENFFWLSVLAAFITYFIVLVIAIAGSIRSFDLYNAGDCEKLRNAISITKLWSIPFYIINFVYSFFVCVCITMGLRGIGIIFAPIPIFLTCLLIFVTGFHGIFYTSLMRKTLPEGQKPTALHYFLQAISVFDIISTILLLKISRENIQQSPKG